jgi:hypothetical protein
MNRLGALVCLFWCTLLPVRACLGQLLVSNDDVKASERSCRIVQLTLQARASHHSSEDGALPDDDFTAAGKACDQLQAAIASSNPQQVQSAAASLQPIFARLGMDPATPEEKLAALEKKDSRLSGEDLFDELPDLAKRAFEAGEIDKAESCAQQLLKMAPDYPKTWNYGNAIFDGNVILGRVALQRGHVKEADRYLLVAGATPGSPQLDSFGPSMKLARDLLAKGQTDVVVQFFELCRHFWEMGASQLDQWSAEVRQGKTPFFGSNLNY